MPLNKPIEQDNKDYYAYDRIDPKFVKNQKQDYLIKRIRAHWVRLLAWFGEDYCIYRGLKEKTLATYTRLRTVQTRTGKQGIVKDAMITGSSLSSTHNLFKEGYTKDPIEIGFQIKLYENTLKLYELALGVSEKEIWEITRFLGTLIDHRPETQRFFALLEKIGDHILDTEFPALPKEPPLRRLFDGPLTFTEMLSKARKRATGKKYRRGE